MWATRMVVHIVSFQQAAIGCGTRNAAATATSTASNMNIISANGIEPGVDFRNGLDERKRGSALPLVVGCDSPV